MPTIEVAIRDICAGCAKGGVKVNEILAAYIARTVGLQAHTSECKQLIAFSWRLLGN